MGIPKSVDVRITKGLRKYRKILDQATRRDVNEADAVTIVKGVLSDILEIDRRRAPYSLPSVRLET
jgi:hypothetical protein